MAKPMPASQAENVSMRIGVKASDDVWFSMGSVDRAIYRDNIMLSRHNRAEIRWVRWRVRPRLLRAKAEQ